MNTNRIEITLPAKDDSGKSHTIVMEERDGELVFTTAKGNEIGKLSVSTQTKEVRDKEINFHPVTGQPIKTLPTLTDWD